MQRIFISSERPSKSKSVISESLPQTVADKNLHRVVGVTSQTPGIPGILWSYHLALALSLCGRKVLLMDVGTDPETLASVLETLTIHPSLNDLLDQPDQILTHEAPGGVQVLAFQMQVGELYQFKPEEREILFQILCEEEQQADIFLINIHFDLRQADLVYYLRSFHEAVLVVSPQDLLGAYSVLKTLFQVQPDLRIGLVEYEMPTGGYQDGAERLVLASKEFLKMSPVMVGKLPSNGFVTESTVTKSPLLASSGGRYRKAMIEIGKGILQGLNTQGTPQSSPLTSLSRAGGGFNGQENRTLFFERMQAQLHGGP